MIVGRPVAGLMLAALKIGAQLRRLPCLAFSRGQTGGLGFGRLLAAARLRLAVNGLGSVLICHRCFA